VDVSSFVEENIEGLYGELPVPCSARPPEDFNISVLQLHIARMFWIVDDLRQSFETYMYIISWKRPMLTAMSCFVSIRLCLKFDLAYIGSLPFLFLLFVMMRSAYFRQKGRIAARFKRRDLSPFKKIEAKLSEFTTNRPIGKVYLTVLQGKNIRSPDNGLPGNARCRIFWDELSTINNSDAVPSPKKSDVMYEIGITSSIYSTSPEWKGVKESKLAKRLKALIPDDGEFFENSNGTANTIEFPALQPIAIRSDRVKALAPWSDSKSSIVFSVQFVDMLSLIPGSEYTLGEVRIPFKDLVLATEIEGWFTLKHNTDNALQNDVNSHRVESDKPQIKVKLKWVPPKESRPAVNSRNILDAEKEASLVVQEELERAAVLYREQKSNLLENSVSAINSVRGLGSHLGWIQNVLGSILDVMEAIHNAFTFTVSDLFVCYLYNIYPYVLISHHQTVQYKGSS
jgi:hypothetical protein